MKKITNHCTTCGACLKSCPKNAIKFVIENDKEEAVIDEKRCIDCGICTKTCPSNHTKKNNHCEIKVARIKNKRNRDKSSSGGLFGELARNFIKKNGVVFGAIFSDDYKEVYHSRCTTENEIEKVFKSKYVRSNLKNTFEEAKKDLENKKLVLYSGTPCQIAGLKSYLKKDYDNLYTVDIICHGTPSPIVWKKYAEYLEREEKSKLKRVEFRYHNKKDSTKNFYIEFENGKVINDALFNTSYGRAFFLGLINGDCCSDCKFNDFRNYSDITLGDTWGYQEDKHYSIIMLNTEKGKKIYSEIKNNLEEKDDFDRKELVVNNYPILNSFNHYNAHKIDVKKKDIDKELWYWLDDKNGFVKDEKGVGILNFHHENYNYGANLVAYSLSEAIKKIGYNPYVIDFDPFPDLDSIKRYETKGFINFRNKHLNMTPRIRKKEDLEQLNKYLDMYVVGSDQVFRKLITQDNLYAYFLDFAKDKNKISYAASFGSNHFEGDNIEKLHCKNLLSTFYKISVRENDGLKILENDFHLKGEVMLDPTLLLTKEEYSNLIDEELEENIDVGVYFITDHNNELIKDKKLKQLFSNKKIVNLKGKEVEKPFGKIFQYNSISKWLDGIKKAKYIVTDSYHGLIFSLLFHKKVICIGKKSTSNSRFQTLSENLTNTIEDIMYSSLDEIKNIHKTINYEEFDKNLEKMRNKSMSYLKNGLGKEKVKEKDDSYELTEELLKKYHEKEEELKQVKEELDSIKYSRSWKLTKPIRAIKKVVKK